MSCPKQRKVQGSAAEDEEGREGGHLALQIEAGESQAGQDSVREMRSGGRTMSGR